MNAETFPPDTPKQVKRDHSRLIDLASDVRHPVVRRAVSLFQASIEKILCLDRMNRCYAEYHENLRSCKGTNDAFRLASRLQGTHEPVFVLT